MATGAVDGEAAGPPGTQVMVVGEVAGPRGTPGTEAGMEVTTGVASSLIVLVLLLQLTVGFCYHYLITFYKYLFVIDSIQ